MVVMMAFMAIVISADPKGPPWPFMLFILLFMGLMTAVSIVPSLLAGYALRKRKRWAKTMSIVAGVMASMSAPIGTAVCIYTFWFLFSEPGKLLYDNQQQMLPQEREVAWSLRKPAVKEEQYLPPPAPPDWR